MLALTQSRWVASCLEKLGLQVSLKIIRTTGDDMTQIPLGQPDTKGLFVKEIEQALLEGRVDLAVHSMKDLPPEIPEGLMVAAVPKREDVRDALVGRTSPTLGSLPENAIVGSSSPRRRAQMMAARSDLKVRDLRGNVDTRLRKLDEGQYDAICLATAGLNRLGLSERITEYLDIDVIMPAACQGALALQVRSDDSATATAVSSLHDRDSGLAVRAESATLLSLGWGCSSPLGLLGTVDGDRICLRAKFCSPDGKSVIHEQIDGTGSPEEIGKDMADRLRTHGSHLLE